MSYNTQGKQDRASAMTMAVLINGSIILAVALSPMVVDQIRPIDRTPIIDIQDKPKPPPPDNKADPKPLDPVFTPPSPMPLPDPINDIRTTPEPTVAQPPVGGTGTSPEPQLPPIVEKPILPAPVFVAATRDPKYAGDFQPAYPALLERRQIEGTVRVKILIGRDGRVRQVQIVSSSDPKFSEATERQALKSWRFRPATRGGEPVEDWQVLTVRFSING